MVLVHHVQEVHAVRIYRIQGPDGRGPFRPGLTEKWIGDPRWADRPSLMEDFDMTDVLARVRGRNMGCGFRTPEQLTTWFDAQERAKLAKYHKEKSTIELRFPPSGAGSQ